MVGRCFCTARFGQRIDFAPVGLFGADDPLVGQQLKGWVDGSGAGFPTAAAALLDLADNLVAVHGALGEQGQHSSPDLSLANAGARTLFEP
jgi:hypothetical protein